ncbi:hypothetical protein CYMTET_26745 [Cymbomonas tetramitiformis]|uniref:rRNA adenine N(6)-methyltransferase n=1 Tax=Cymbomonas tetramitiformis TaxID=36881 RepID=A0AAE0FRS5_9CHLO|nr:hypothetical protein CYMTET_26745 [Cymbomonas tetramitiformis]
MRAGDVQIGPGTGVLTAELLAAGASVTAVEKPAADDLSGGECVNPRELSQRSSGGHGPGLSRRFYSCAVCARGRALGVLTGPGLRLRGWRAPVQDEVLATGLSDFYSSCPALEVVCADFMRWRKKEELLLPEHESPAKVVANLPYNITSDALKRLLPKREEFSLLVVMVQAEAAERLVAACAGDKDYRAVSVRVQFYSEPSFVQMVGRKAFFPAPNVDSAVISFALKEQLPDVQSEHRFFQLVATSFVHKRKMLRNNLKGMGFSPAQVEAALLEMEKPCTSRPADLSMTDYVQLHHVLEGGAEDDSMASPHLELAESSDAAEKVIESDHMDGIRNSDNHET